MKTIIAGGREFEISSNELEEVIKKSGIIITELVSGCATGVDKAGEFWAKLNNIPIKKFPADWDRLGRSAGPIRNQLMAQYAEALIAIWDGRSPGTKNMITTAEKRKLKVFIYRY